MRHRITTITGRLIATALICTWLALAAFPSGASACFELSCGRAQTAQTAQTVPVIVHETLAAHNNNPPLPIILAASALLIAVAAAGYTTVLATRTSRRAARRSA